MALAALLYIYRVTETTIVSTLTRGRHRERTRAHPAGQDVPSYVTILRIHGPFLFGMTDKLADATADLGDFATDRDSAAAEHDAPSTPPACMPSRPSATASRRRDAS